MRASVRDHKALATLRPLEIGAYLRNQGWRELNTGEPDVSTWLRKDGEGNELEVFLPLRHDMRDYPVRVSEVLSVLEAAERRSQLEIFRDLTTSGADVIRVAVGTREHESALQLESAASLITGARELILAAACAAVRPAAHFPTRKPGPAVDYLQKVKLGQTEHGSFVFTFISPVAPALTTFTDAPTIPIEEPFERKAVKTLTRATSAAATAATRAALDGRFESFESAIPNGVSANLCNAISKMSDSLNAPEGFQLGVSWSKNRPFLQDAPARVILRSDAIPIIEEAARILQEYHPEEVDVEGYVVKLERSPDQSRGRATVFADVDGRYKNIRIELEGNEYHAAIHAHEQGLVVGCRGTLQKAGNTFTLTGPHNFHLQNAPEAD